MSEYLNYVKKDIRKHFWTIVRIIKRENDDPLKKMYFGGKLEGFQTVLNIIDLYKKSEEDNEE